MKIVGGFTAIKDLKNERFFNRTFFYRLKQDQIMRSWVVGIGLCLFFFIIPLHCFIIGDSMGYGIQGAVYRYQITANGESFIPITTEFTYIASGLITGKTAVSIILWVLGTIVLAIATMTSHIIWNDMSEKEFLLLLKTMTLAEILYLASAVMQYGILLSGPAGRSLPIGLILLFMFIASSYYYRETFLEPSGEISTPG